MKYYDYEYEEKQKKNYYRNLEFNKDGKKWHSKNIHLKHNF